VGFWLPTFPTLTQLAGLLDEFTGTAGAARVDPEREEVTVTHRGWTLRVLWDAGQAGWVYAIEDDTALITVDAGLVETATDLADGYRRLVARQASAAPAMIAAVALPRQRPPRARSRRRPGHPRPRRR
jgi:hypothetical protein